MKTAFNSINSIKHGAGPTTGDDLTHTMDTSVCDHPNHRAYVRLCVKFQWANDTMRFAHWDNDGIYDYSQLDRWIDDHLDYVADPEQKTPCPGCGESIHVGYHEDLPGNPNI